MTKRGLGRAIAVAAGVAVIAAMAGCMASRGSGGAASGSAAEKVYVKPGEHDTYYGFLSGGHHGNIYVYGFPSCRHITKIGRAHV